MHKFLIGLITGTAVLAGLTGARAASAITYVSGTGNDANSCASPAAACRNLARAISQSTGNGIIIVLTPDGYCGGTIDKGITILGNGPGATVVPCGGGGALTVTAPAGAVVTIRGLSIDFRNSATGTGITFTSGAVLRLEECLIRGTLKGIQFTAPGGELYVSNCTIADSSSNAVSIVPSGGKTIAVLDRVRIQSAVAQGLLATGGGAGTSISVAIRDSSVSGGASHGISVQATGAGSVSMLIDRSMLANNGLSGVNATGAKALIRITDSTVTGNTSGLSVGSGASIENLAPNRIIGNGDDTPSALVAKQRR